MFVLHEGYAREDDADRVGSSVTLIVDGGRVIVVNPGMVAGRDALLSALAGRGPDPAGVTDVVFSHHHPDHTVNAALFPRAVIHDHWASYDGDRWISREPGDFALTPSVRLIATPGHTAEDITTLAATPDDVYACTHAWWGPEGPAEDPLLACLIVALEDDHVARHGRSFRRPACFRMLRGRPRDSPAWVPSGPSPQRIRPRRP